MNLFVSFSARETGNCAQIIDYLKTPQDKVIRYMDLNAQGCQHCNYECFDTRCKYRDDAVYGLYRSFRGYEKVILVVPMYCGNPSSLYFSFTERGQDFFMHQEEEYAAFAENLFIIGVYGSRGESPDFVRCFEKWFEGTPYTNHVLGIERHPHRQTMQDCVLDIPAVKSALKAFLPGKQYRRINYGV